MTGFDRYRLRITREYLWSMAIGAGTAAALLAIGLAAPFLNAWFGWRLGSIYEYPAEIGIGIVAFLLLGAFSLWRAGWPKGSSCS